MRRSNGRKPQLPTHGQIKVASMKLSHAKNHLRIISESAAKVRDYGGHEATGYDSKGDFAPGGAAGANYQTTSVNDNPDPDFAGTSR
jgi:hypothetical protein